jgi:thymidylate kinase
MTIAFLDNPAAVAGRPQKPTLNDYVLAGQLCAPDAGTVADAAIDCRDVDPEVILSILRTNKVPLVNLDRGRADVYPEFFSSAAFKAQYALEYEQCRQLKREWVRVRNEFVKAGIESMLIKSVGFFPYRSSNLDVLIQQDKRQRAQSILSALGYIQLHNVAEPYKTLFRTFKGGKSTSVIHLHDKVAWINPFHDERLLWERFRSSAAEALVDIPSPADSILILTAHWFYENKELNLSDIVNIAACLKEDDPDWEYLRAVAVKMGWLKGLYFGLLVQSHVEKKLLGRSSIADDQLQQMRAALPLWMRTYLDKRIHPRPITLPFRFPKIYGKFLHIDKTLRDRTIAPARKIQESARVAYASMVVVLLYRFGLNIRRQPAMLISISGVDGSGKSTCARQLQDILDFCQLRTAVVWSRVGSSGFLKPFSKIMRFCYRLVKRKKIANEFENFAESQARRRDLFGRAPGFKTVGALALLVEMLWLYAFKVALPLLFKKIVICDRYVYDTLVDVKTRYAIHPHTREGRLFKKLLTSLTPRADIAYLLDIAFEESCRRQNVDVRQAGLIRDQIRSYREVAGLFQLHQIDTGDGTSVTDIGDKMAHETLTRYYGSWPAGKSGGR